MQPTNQFQLAKLGAHVEYLRGIASVSIIPATSLVEFPQVMANQPETRFCVAKVVETIRALLLQLEEMQLTEAQAAAAPLCPMVQEMEQALAGAPNRNAITLRDHFAERIVGHARLIGLALRQELSSRQIG
ncbi:MAG: hypothetical protein ACKVP0_26610 [Pirellulaceae bacterium]